MSAFINCDPINQEIENVYNQNPLRVKFDEYRSSWENSLKIRIDEHLDAVKSIRFSEKRKNIENW